MYEVETGRRDGCVSKASEAVNNLPSSFWSIYNLTKSFASKGLNLKDLAVLSGTIYILFSLQIQIKHIYKTNSC
jgi:Peroxidase